MLTRLRQKSMANGEKTKKKKQTKVDIEMLKRRISGAAKDFIIDIF